MYKNKPCSMVVGSDFPRKCSRCWTPVTDLLSLQRTVQHLMQYWCTI